MKIKHTTLLLLCYIITISAQDYFPLQMGNFWRYESPIFTSSYTTRITDTTRVKDQLYYRCPINLGGFSFDYLRVDNETNELIALLEDTTYTLIDFNVESQDTFSYPVAGHEDTVMGNIIKVGHYDKLIIGSFPLGTIGEFEDVIEIVLDPLPYAIDDEYYIYLCKDFGLFAHCNQGGGPNLYGLEEASANGKTFNSVGVSSLKASHKRTMSKPKKVLNHSLSNIPNCEKIQLNGRKVDTDKLSRGMFINNDLK